jgi:hypothetical protein
MLLDPAAANQDVAVHEQRGGDRIERRVHGGQITDAQHETPDNLYRGPAGEHNSAAFDDTRHSWLRAFVFFAHRVSGRA